MNAADSRIKRYFPRRPTSGGFLASDRAVIGRLFVARGEEIALALVLLIGLGLTIYGLASIYQPLGSIVAGLLLIVLSLGYLRGRSPSTLKPGRSRTPAR
jgi:hypothetical protein